MNLLDQINVVYGFFKQIQNLPNIRGLLLAASYVIYHKFHRQVDPID